MVVDDFSPQIEGIMPIVRKEIRVSYAAGVNKTSLVEYTRIRIESQTSCHIKKASKPNFHFSSNREMHINTL